MSPEGGVCSVHGTLFSDIRDDLGKILAALDELREGQALRREICAAERARIDALEREVETIKNKESGEIWAAINELRRLVHRGTGLALALAAVMPVATGIAVYLVTKGLK